MRRKLGFLCLALVLAMGTLGVGYALWYEDLYIEGTVNTGTVDVEWSYGPVWDTETKDVSWSDVVIDGDTMYITIYNAYPSIWYHHQFDIHSVGTIPVHFTDWVIDRGNLPAGATLQIWEDSSNPGGGPITDAQLHEGDMWYGCVEVHLDNDAAQGAQYTFSISVMAHQYNETP